MKKIDWLKFVPVSKRTHLTELERVQDSWFKDLHDLWHNLQKAIEAEQEYRKEKLLELGELLSQVNKKVDKLDGRLTKKIADLTTDFEEFTEAVVEDQKDQAKTTSQINETLKDLIKETKSIARNQIYFQQAVKQTFIDVGGLGFEANLENNLALAKGESVKHEAS